jgi:ABC-2 type transport system ATP-binding protein
MTGEPMVRVEGLRKTFPGKRKAAGHWWSRLLAPGRASVVAPFVAVDEVSFSVGAGEIFGLLGPNGAGKTTTIRMLATLLEPTAGTATINGFDVYSEPNQVRQSLGAVLTGERSIYWKLTGRENLAYFAALYHLPPEVAKRRVGELLERLGLAHRADDLVERYSSGMKQRIAIAKALLANPPVVLLDEPTVGLDPQSARNLREIILDIKREGRTVLLTTHYMEEADQLADRIGIIDVGRIIALDTPTRLKASIHQSDVLHLEVENFDPALTAALGRLPTVERIGQPSYEREGTGLLAVQTTDSRNLLPLVIDAVATRAGRIRHLEVGQPSLEDVFIALTGKQLRE